MSEISKCPLCGKVPGWHDFDIEARIFGGERSYFCCGMKASTAVLWNQYAAAMDLAKATRTLEDAMEPLNSGKLKMGKALPAIRLAMEDQKVCEQRVLEVFGK